MKKKLFVFGVLSMVVLFSACKPAVKGGDTSNSETPLELTAANLAGKWVLESDSSKWYEFKKDKTFTSNTVTTANSGTFEFEDGKLQLYMVSFGVKGKYSNRMSITIYKKHIVIDNKKYLR